MPTPVDPPGEQPFDAGAMANQVAQVVAGMREAFAPMDEAALGYRAQLEKAGWSPTVAEQMAAQFYTFTIATFMKGTD